jgi:hypothetical protein
MRISENQRHLCVKTITTKPTRQPLWNLDPPMRTGLLPLLTRQSVRQTVTRGGGDHQIQTAMVQAYITDDVRRVSCQLLSCRPS